MNCCLKKPVNEVNLLAKCVVSSKKVRMPEIPPTIDCHRIDYPSDRVTIKQLRVLARANDPTAELHEFFAQVGELPEIMHSCEEQFANLGFARGTGNPQLIRHAQEVIMSDNEEPDFESAYLVAIRELTSYYKQFGIADGIETTKQLVRRLEENAAEQARQLLGRTTGGDS